MRFFVRYVVLCVTDFPLNMYISLGCLSVFVLCCNVRDRTVVINILQVLSMLLSWFSARCVVASKAHCLARFLVLSVVLFLRCAHDPNTITVRYIIVLFCVGPKIPTKELRTGRLGQGSSIFTCMQRKDQLASNFPRSINHSQCPKRLWVNWFHIYQINLQYARNCILFK